ncbi:UDP-N-acetylmuramoyl-L-alanyl-D-glutamate--2,6-diaminopimelate ligase [Niabella ginsengisoli]|uniref:UDP-N-acetylmuramoyl-L-alanyl-D-glutamate--2, 6-diaminopimelate ligase n=1 Tax=Niabella ginsengisoli TaxID=522298 RepID=A0ABS9SR65_9BACT|nr:UDP-N-acetylmuramoyl-L-alanyl-D-glutamate--2,6-diaminopimelate ligase [Niabella ginsengisoli]MCH5600888.1 UDP-N-acetylmuramoyl-L-alanyl-D-glutamate--2,6-diaminopimelate ligase [Niabella ginsengisoli]
MSVSGNTDIDITGICIDSRNIQPGNIFIALKGSATDGHQFIEKAITDGAIAIVCEILPEIKKPEIVYIQVSNGAVAAGITAHNFYGNPSSKVKLLGVTGTNGKTTVATLLYQLFSNLGYKCGLLSTVQNHIGSQVVPATHTTPDAVQLNQLLKLMVDEGCSHVFMEVSSHAINQQRIAGLEFEVGIFTNISHDHLDYHKTFDEYIRVKKLFFDTLPKKAYAITNIDDRRGVVMVQNTNATVKTYSLKTVSDFKGKILDNGIMGLHMVVDEQEVHFRLIGEFNAHNLLAAYGAAICLGHDKYEVLQTLSVLNGAEGRFEYVISPSEKIIAIIDYAHTPDALLNVLATIRKLKKGFEQVITIAGCGGNRDKTKRPVMAEVACEQSDKVIFTSDNPALKMPVKLLKKWKLACPRPQEENVYQ